MAKIALKDRYGRVIAEVGEDDPVMETGETAVIDTKPAVRVAAPEATGYVEEDFLETWTESTVQIPANFAGMESLMVPTRLRNQLFDIVKVDEQEGYVEITAVHMFYRQRQNHTTWAPNATTRYSGASACRNVLTNAMFDSGFNVASDSTDLIDGNRLDYENKNIVEAFLDPESGICAKWGLSLIRDNDVFYCLKNVGYDRGFVIQNRKNMIGVEREEDVEETITRVAPVARDESGDLVWMDYGGKKYLDSIHINDYPAPKLEIYHTDLRIGENGVTAENIQEKLLEAAQKRFSEDEVDIPDITMTVQFVSLGDTEEYAQYRDLDKVYLFDIIHVKDTDRGYSYSAQVVGVQHNVLTGVLESITIGKLKKWNGIRKIGSWQVPEFNGGQIRPGSIRPGAYESGSVRADDIADGAIGSQHLGNSADGRFKSIFAEELYISNTSEDGLLHTQFAVTEGLIASSVADAKSDMRSEIVQTASMIRSAVSASQSQIWSEVLQTASFIRSEVHNSLSAFYTEIIQTASSIVIRTGTDTRTYHQPTAPVGTQEDPLVDGDLWFNSEGQFTWGDASDKSWLDDSTFDWGKLKEADVYRYDGVNETWVQVINERAIMQDTKFEQNREMIQLVAGRVDVNQDKIESYRAEFKVEADQIKSTVSEQVSGAYSRITQTANEIRSEVRSSSSGIYSSISQTASQIRLEVRNAVSGLSSSITQQADRISLVVQGTGSNASIKPASIVAAINNGASSVIISASHIDLNGYVKATDITSDFINGKIAHISSMNVSGNINAGSYMMAPYIYLGSVGNANSLAGAIKSLKVVQDGNNYKIQKMDFDDSGWVDVPGTFSRATTLSGAWSSGVFTASASPQGETLITSLTVGAFSWSGLTATAKIYATIGNSGAVYETGKAASIDVSGIFNHLGRRELGYMDHGNFESVGTHDWYYL